MCICKADPVHPMLLLFNLQNAQRGAVNTSRGGSATLCGRNNQQTINMLTTRHAMTPPVPYEPRSAVQWSLACTAQPGNDIKTEQPQKSLRGLHAHGGTRDDPRTAKIIPSAGYAWSDCAASVCARSQRPRPGYLLWPSESQRPSSTH